MAAINEEEAEALEEKLASKLKHWLVGDDFVVDVDELLPLDESLEVVLAEKEEEMKEEMASLVVAFLVFLERWSQIAANIVAIVDKIDVAVVVAWMKLLGVALYSVATFVVALAGHWNLKILALIVVLGHFH